MAITKIIGAIHPPKSGGRYRILKNAIDYVLKPSKTEGGLYTGAINCMTDSALQDMINTKNYYGKTSDSPSERLGYHFVISFNPEEEIDNETAFKVIQEFCDAYLKSEYECVYSVHTDQKHKHGHIVFNSVNLHTGRKFRYENDDWARIIQPITDELCKKYGLHTLQMDTGMSLEEYEKDIKKKRLKKKYGGFQKNDDVRGRSSNKYYKEKNEEYSKQDYVKHDIDEIILECNSMEQFYDMLKSYGYEVKKGVSKIHGKYFSVIKSGMDRYRRNYVLGKNYTVDAIKERIEMKNKPLPLYPVVENTRYALPYGYWKKPRRELSGWEKRYYRIIYKLGLRKVNVHPNYYAIRQNLKNIRKIENQITIIQNYGLCDADSVKSAIEKIQGEIQEIEMERKEFYQQHMPYLDLVKSYRQMKKLEESFLLYENGENTFKEQHDEYLKLKDKIEKYGFSEEEIESFDRSMKDKLKEYNKKKYEKRKIIKQIETIAQEMNMVEDEKELEYENIPEPNIKNEKNRAKI